jgi:hypothetical protein
MEVVQKEAAEMKKIATNGMTDSKGKKTPAAKKGGK